MAEHVPPRALIGLLALFLVMMSVSALLFWLAALLAPGGVRSVIEAVGFAAFTVFGALHIVAAITGILLWQWERHGLHPYQRVALEAATLYFGLAVLISIALNYLAASLLERFL